MGSLQGLQAFDNASVHSEWSPVPQLACKALHDLARPGSLALVFLLTRLCPSFRQYHGLARTQSVLLLGTPCFPWLTCACPPNPAQACAPPRICPWLRPAALLWLPVAPLPFLWYQDWLSVPAPTHYRIGTVSLLFFKPFIILVYNSVTFRAFTTLCDHLLYLMLERDDPKRNPQSPQQSLPASLSSSPW